MITSVLLVKFHIEMIIMVSYVSSFNLKNHSWNVMFWNMYAWILKWHERSGIGQQSWDLSKCTEGTVVWKNSRHTVNSLLLVSSWFISTVSDCLTECSHSTNEWMEIVNSLRMCPNYVATAYQSLALIQVTLIRVICTQLQLYRPVHACFERN